MRLFKDIYYSEIKDCDHTLDVYTPDTEGFPVFVYFHGGGLEHGNKDNPRRIADAEYLTKHGIGLVSINYRKYPNAKYPEFILDAAEAVAFTKEHISEYGGNGKIFVGGSSAGGYLSMMLCFDERYLGKHGILPTDITGYIHDAGQPTSHFNVLREFGIDSRRVIIDETAPLYHVGKAESYSPMLIIYSDNDMKNRPEQLNLLLSTLNHFEYDRSKIDTIIMHGKHCHYLKENDADGSSKFGRMIYQFIEKYV